MFIVTLLKALLILVCLLLTLLTVLQDTKGGGLAGALVGYGGGSVFGAEAGGRIVRWTAYLAAAFFFLVLLTGKCEQQTVSSSVVGAETPESRPLEVPQEKSVEVELPASGVPTEGNQPRDQSPSSVLPGSKLPEEETQ